MISGSPPSPTPASRFLSPYAQEVLTPDADRDRRKILTWCLVLASMLLLKTVVRLAIDDYGVSVTFLLVANGIILVLVAGLAGWTISFPRRTAVGRGLAVAIHLVFCIRLLWFWTGAGNDTMAPAVLTGLVVMATTSLISLPVWLHGVLCGWPLLLLGIAVPVPFLGQWIDRSTENRVLLFTGFALFALAAFLIALFNELAQRALEQARNRLQQLGSYRLVEQIGVGGMSEVWTARHALLQRTVAVKIIRPETIPGNMPFGEAIARFEREAQVTASLSSPHTIRIFDFGHTGSGLFFYVMEYLEGIPLDRLLQRYGPLPQARVRHILLQLCDSLDEAHGRGLVHRDLKPGNVLLCRLGTRVDQVKLLDFGLALTFAPRPPTADRQGASGRMTEHGFINGTPAFMSPEQIRNDEVDARSDIYALGVMTYWMLSGAEPFTNPATAKVLEGHLHHEPPDLAGRCPGPLAPGLIDLVRRCLAKDPCARFPSCRALSAALALLPMDVWSQQDAFAWYRDHPLRTSEGHGRHADPS